MCERRGIRGQSDRITTQHKQRAASRYKKRREGSGRISFRRHAKLSLGIRAVKNSAASNQRRQHSVHVDLIFLAISANQCLQSVPGSSARRVCLANMPPWAVAAAFHVNVPPCSVAAGAHRPVFRRAATETPTCRHRRRRPAQPPPALAACATRRLASLPPRYFWHFHSEVVSSGISLDEVVSSVKKSYSLPQNNGVHLCNE